MKLVIFGLSVSSSWGNGHATLWRGLIRARYAGDGVAGVRRTLDAMTPALRGLPVESQTTALVEEYLPTTASTGA